MSFVDVEPLSTVSVSVGNTLIVLPNSSRRTLDLNGNTLSVTVVVEFRALVSRAALRIIPERSRRTGNGHTGQTIPHLAR